MRGERATAPYERRIAARTTKISTTELEKMFLAFMEGKFHILRCTPSGKAIARAVLKMADPSDLG